MTSITWNLCVRSRWRYWKIRKLSLESSFVHRVWKSRIDNRRRRLQLRILRQKYHADRQHQAGYGDRGNIIHPLTQFTKVMQDRSNEHTFTRTLASETVSLKKEAATAACIKLAAYDMKHKFQWPWLKLNMYKKEWRMLGCLCYADDINKPFNVNQAVCRCQWWVKYF